MSTCAVFRPLVSQSVHTLKPFYARLGIVLSWITECRKDLGPHPSPEHLTVYGGTSRVAGFSAEQTRPVMTKILQFTLVLVASIGLVACSTSGQSTNTNGEEGTPQDRIVVAELEAPVAGLTAYDIVNQYKSNWLLNSGAKSLKNDPKIQVYLNNHGSPAGTVSALRRIRAMNVASIEYLSPTEAQFRFGMGHSVGAIVVHMKGAHSSNSDASA